MEELIKVGIADLKLCRTPDKITTIGLGSCVGIVLFNPTSPVCGMVHIMLPSSKEISNNDNRAKFADSGIADLVQELIKNGLAPTGMSAKIAGGATMFQFSGSTDLGSIGVRNIQATKQALASYRIPIVAEDTGLNYGRTIIFDSVTKQLIVRSAGKPDKII